MSLISDPVRRRAQKLVQFFMFAENFAKLSTCRRAQVGAIVFDPACTAVHAIGYNGQPAGMPHDGCKADQPGACGCVHAEANALLKLRRPAHDLDLYSTLSPCVGCAGLIINAGIRRVYYLEPFRDTAGLKLLEDAGLFVIRRANVFLVTQDLDPGDDKTIALLQHDTAT